MTLFHGNQRAIVVTFEDDEVFGGAWRVRRLLVLTGGMRVMVHPSTYYTAGGDRLQVIRNVGRRGLMVEDWNRLFGVNVIMASDFVLELLERSLVQWTDVDAVARNPDVLLDVYTLVCVCYLKGMNMLV